MAYLIRNDVRHSYGASPGLTSAAGICVAMVICFGVAVALSTGATASSRIDSSTPRPALVLSPVIESVPSSGTPAAGAPPVPGTPLDPEPEPEMVVTTANTVTTGAATDHQIRPGETLSSIAASHHTTVVRLAADNAITNFHKIRAGRHLAVRGAQPSVTVIRPGSTLSKYARSTGSSIAELMRKNPQLTDPNRILAGGRLYV